MPAMPTTTLATFPAPKPRLVDGVTWVDLTITNVAKGSGSIFVTDGAVQTVIDRVTGEPKLRVVGGTFKKEISLDKVSIKGNVVSFDAGGLPPGATMNVYMGAGTLLSGGKPVGAITVPGSASFTAPTGDAPSGLSATIAVEDKTLKAGADIKVTVSFSKAVSSLDLGAITAEHASVKDLSHSADMRTWTITLGATDSVESAANVLRLDMSKVSADGARGSGTLTSGPYAVDTIVDAYILPYLGFNDEGPSYEDGVTNDNEQYMSGVLVGEPAADEHIELIINGTRVDQARIRLIGEGDSWYWYYDPEVESGPTPTFNEGKNTVSVRLVKADGHSSAAVIKDIVIDTNTPDIVAKPTTPVDAGQAITISFDEAMYLDGHAEVVNEIEVVDGFGNTSWITLYNSMFSADRKTLTISAADHNLATGNSYRFSLPYGLTDLAGNEYEGEEIAFTTAGEFQDKAPPRLVQAYIVNGSGSYKAGDVLEFRLRYTEKVKLDAGTDPVLYLEGGMKAVYVGLANDGSEMVFKYTVKAGDNEESLSDVYHDSVLYGHVRDDRGNVFDRAHVEYDGLTTAGGYGAYVSIDTDITQPGTPQLHAASEGTAPGTGTTADSKPRLTGSGAEEGASISIYAGGVKVGSTTADALGRWDTVLTAALSSGTHEIKVSQQDLAGNVSALSAPFSLTITSSAPPTLSAPVLEASSDTGVSNSDRITLNDQPAIGGTAPANASLKLKHNGVDLPFITADASGKWSYTLHTLPEGVHTFTVQEGASGPASSALTITVDRTRPSVGSAWDNPVTNFNPNGDLVISFSEAVHIAPSEGEDDMLRLVDGNGLEQKIAVSDANLSADKRTLTISGAEHTLQALTSYRAYLPATLTDIAGMGIDEYEIRFTTGNDALPGAVRAIVVGDGSYRAGEIVTIRVRFDEQVEKWGESGLSLGLSNSARATFSGMSASGEEALFSYTVAANDDTASLKISDTSALVGRFVDLSGNMLDSAHITLGDLYDGYGSKIDIGIDTVATAPGLPLLAPDSNSGGKLDFVTNDRTPTLTGSAEAYARVELYKGTSLLGQAYADAAGNWAVTVEAGKDLADGAHQLTVRQIDRAGNASPASVPLNVTVDNAVATLAAPRLADGYDTGWSAADNLTRENRPVFAGSGAEAGAKIMLMVGTTVLGSGTADANGDWQAGLSTEAGILLDGGWAFTVKQEDLAGNLSAASSALVINVDRSAPTAPGAPVLAIGSDSGSSNSDGITNVVKPTFTGSGAEAGATIVLYAGAREIGRPTADALGNWTLTVAEEDKFTSDNTYAITAKQIDKAGNTSVASSAFSLVIDTVGPSVTGFESRPGVREFQLGFNERIVFSPTGMFRLVQSATDLLSFTGSSSGNWYTSDSAAGEHSVLNFKISMTGLYNLYMNNESVKDLAGNVAIIGSPQWLVDLPAIT